MAVLRISFFLSVCMLYVMSSTNAVPGNSKITIDIRYEMECDDGIASCNQNSSANNPTSATSSPSTTVTSAPVTVTKNPVTVTNSTSASVVTTEGPFRCNATGSFADPNNCRSFYRCDDAESAPKHNDCPILFRFDSSKAGCVFGLTC